MSFAERPRVTEAVGQMLVTEKRLQRAGTLAELLTYLNLAFHLDQGKIAESLAAEFGVAIKIDLKRKFLMWQTQEVGLTRNEFHSGVIQGIIELLTDLEMVNGAEYLSQVAAQAENLAQAEKEKNKMRVA